MLRDAQVRPGETHLDVIQQARKERPPVGHLIGERLSELLDHRRETRARPEPAGQHVPAL